MATYDYRELEDNGRKFCFMALEYVRGESLADLLARENTLQEELALDASRASSSCSVFSRAKRSARDSPRTYSKAMKQNLRPLSSSSR